MTALTNRVAEAQLPEEVHELVKCGDEQMSEESNEAMNAPPFPWRFAILPSLRWGLFAAVICALTMFIPVVGCFYLGLALFVGAFVGRFTEGGHPSWPWFPRLPLVAYTAVFALFRLVHLFLLHHNVTYASHTPVEPV